MAFLNHCWKTCQHLVAQNDIQRHLRKSLWLLAVTLNFFVQVDQLAQGAKSSLNLTQLVHFQPFESFQQRNNLEDGDWQQQALSWQPEYPLLSAINQQLTYQKSSDIFIFNCSLDFPGRLLQNYRAKNLSCCINAFKKNTLHLQVHWRSCNRGHDSRKIITCTTTYPMQSHNWGLGRVECTPTYPYLGRQRGEIITCKNRIILKVAQKVSEAFRLHCERFCRSTTN